MTPTLVVRLPAAMAITALSVLLSGCGPCNRDRIEHHKKAHNDGQWVREAMRAYESKKRQHLAA